MRAAITMRVRLQGYARVRARPLPHAGGGKFMRAGWVGRHYHVAVAEVLTGSEALAAVVQRAEREHVGKVEVRDGARLVLEPAAVLLAARVGDAEVGEDLCVDGRVQARDSTVVVALP